MFRIGLEISGTEPGFKAHADRGIGRYITELTAAIQRLGDDSINILPFKRNELRGGSVVLEALRRFSSATPLGRATLTQQVSFPFLLKGAGFDLVHFPAHMDAPAWGLKGYVLTVLDLIPLVCADLYKAPQLGLRFRVARFLELQAIRNAGVILAISENTARDVNRILGVPADRIFVTPLGVDQRFFSVRRRAGAESAEVRRLLGLPQGRPIVLYVGGIDPRKNIGFLLRSFRALLDKGGGERPLLVMCGNIGSDREYPRVMGLLDHLNLKHDVCMPGFVPDERLLSLYAESSVFFFPSLYEGFGLPALEAMAAGTPVVTSKTSCMPEVVGQAGLMIDPLAEREAVEALEAVLTKRELSSDLSERGRVQARNFSWESTGRLTLDAYRECYRRVMQAV